VFKFAGIIFGGLLLLLAGCTSVYQGSEAPPPREWSLTNAVAQPPSSPKNLAARLGVKSTPAPATQPHPAKISQRAPLLMWTSLKRWTAEHHVSAPRLLSSTPLANYMIRSTNGTMILAIGSHGAMWNGTEINLGFEPQIIDGEVFLYELDLEKELEPLLCGPPLTFGTNRVIVIDPGHGGSNTGTHSVLDGRFEKEFTLDWAERLKPLLETNGWTVFLTRTNDSDFSLSNRVVFAEVHHADLFISLHFNSAAPDTNQAGLETYCLTPTGMPSTLTRGYADDWEENLPNNRFDAQNLLLAVQLQSALVHMTGEEDRGVRHARFIGVLRGQKRPAVLIEAGYLSNPAEAEQIESAAYRQKLAETVAATLK
jgi:N-acetylmuramoyl-L-alanine amidase